MDLCSPSRPILCPVHKGRDHVRRVSVVYAEAAPVLLSPAPAVKAASRLAWAGTTCGLAGAVLLWLRALVGGALSGPAVVIAVICFGYGIAFYGWAGVRRMNAVRIGWGMQRALAVWRAGWYCDRCEGVFFVPGEAPPGASADDLMTAREFRELVWSAGGYLAKAS